MRRISFAHSMTGFRIILACVAAMVATTAAVADPSGPPCRASFDAVRLAYPLAQVGKRIAAKQPVTIVALGSSSTAGAGASSPDANYPNRLKAELSRLFPGREFNVINRGVNGEEVKDMIARFDRDVAANKPDLVLWQFGSNSLIRNHALSDDNQLIHNAIRVVRGIGADLVLIDPQYAPRIIAKANVAEAIDYMGVVAKSESIGLFRRFELMRRWQVVDGLTSSDFIVQDGLHMNDWGYACFARALAAAVAEAATQRNTPAATVARIPN